MKAPLEIRQASRTRTGRRVLLAAEIGEGNVGWSFATLLPELGCEVRVVDERAYFAYDPASRFSRAQMKLTLPLREAAYNRALQKAAHAFRPDVVLALKGSRIWPATLRRLRGTGASLASYVLDDYFPLAPDAVTGHMHRAIGLYDLIVTTKRHNVVELEQRGCRRVAFVRCGYDPRVHYPLVPSERDLAQFGSDVLFVGTYEAERAALLEDLVRRYPVGLAVYGNGWEAVPRRSPLYPYLKRRSLYGRDKLAAFATCRIALCLLRKANRDTYTDRSFEIPACGAFTLAERTAEHLALYEEGKEMACFEGAEELAEKVRYYLDHRAEREAIAAAGHARLLAGHHTYKDRLYEILGLVASPQPAPNDSGTVAV